MKILKTTAFACLISLSIFTSQIFLPKKYAVKKFEPRSNEQYWNLPTGSKIGYTLVPAQGAKKPFPIIFLHGGPGGWCYDATVAALAPLAENGFDVYLYDQLGAGHSAKLDDIEGYTAERHERDLAAIVQQIGTKKVVLIGQSWGAILATMFVADHPELVEKLVLTGPGPLFPVNPALKNIAPPDSLHLREPMATNQQANEKLNSLRTKAMAWFATSFGVKIAPEVEADDFETLLNSGLRKSVVCDTTALSRHPAQGGNGFYCSVMTMASLAAVPDPRPKLRGSNVPLLLLRGQCDNQKWGFQTEYLDLFPNHELAVVSSVGHVIYLEQPGTYLERLRAFLLR